MRPRGQQRPQHGDRLGGRRGVKQTAKEPKRGMMDETGALLCERHSNTKIYCVAMEGIGYRLGWGRAHQRGLRVWEAGAMDKLQ